MRGVRLPGGTAEGRERTHRYLSANGGSGQGNLKAIRSEPPGERREWEVYQVRQNRTSVPATHPSLLNPSSSTAMTNDPLDPLDTDQRPQKRPRQTRDMDLGVRAYTIPTAGPSTLQSETDGNPDEGPKKGRKRPLSCGECRRLKLKCDRVFPCQSCCKRGCAEICPDGALTGGKGSRFILANTEQLHEKIKTMSERIRQLEEALQVLQSQISPDEHPLLRQDLLSIKKSPELFGMDGSAATYTRLPHTRTSPDDDSLHNDPRGSRSPSRNTYDEASAPQHAGPSGSPPYNPPSEFARLSHGFPSPWSVSFQLNPGVRAQIREMLPTMDEARHLCEQARVRAFWQFNPHSSHTFLPNLIHSVYNSNINSLLPHRLGLFLMILATGCRVDSKPSSHQDAERYYSLARVALCEVSVMDDTSFDAVNAMFIMVWYLLMFSEDKRAVEFSWGLTGIMLKLSTAIGLHRDSTRSKVIPEELDKRRILFWDIVNVEARLSLMLRRPPNFNRQHIDTRSPTFSSDPSSGGMIGASYFEWQHNFLIECMLPVVDVVSAARAPSYISILALDSRIRDFDVPSSLRMMDQDDDSAHPLALHQAMIACHREVALLQLHRNYFTQALNVSDGFTFKHKYAPSVLATFTSSCNLIWTVYTLYRWEPTASVKFTPFWSNCFSAAVALCFFMSKVPSCALVTQGLQEIDRMIQLFGQVKDYCPSAARFLPAVQALSEKTRTTHLLYKSGMPTEGDFNDEICSLGRRIGVLQGNLNTMLSQDDTTESDPFDHAHPSLVRCLEKAMVEPPCMDEVVDRTDVMWDVNGVPLKAFDGFGKGIQDTAWLKIHTMRMKRRRAANSLARRMPTRDTSQIGGTRETQR
ncbi:hypothetical protein QCA50_006672 [Cerrena zonata]|uniref:Zn(2)-C6 fungal-type domain-containing protein n=1 Tax=Cerrena zonata TaxID=2478898 RepID=A0AAW0G9A7_9APHY